MQEIANNEGDDIKIVVKTFCIQNNIGNENMNKLEQALRNRIINPPPLSLLLGINSILCHALK